MLRGRYRIFFTSAFKQHMAKLAYWYSGEVYAPVATVDISNAFGQSRFLKRVAKRVGYFVVSCATNELI